MYGKRETSSANAISVSGGSMPTAICIPSEALQPSLRSWLAVCKMVNFLDRCILHVQVAHCLLSCSSVWIQWSWVHYEKVPQSQKIEFLLVLLALLRIKASHVPVLWNEDTLCDVCLDILERSLSLPKIGTIAERSDTIFCRQGSPLLQRLVYVVPSRMSTAMRSTAPNYLRNLRVPFFTINGINSCTFIDCFIRVQVFMGFKTFNATFTMQT